MKFLNLFIVFIFLLLKTINFGQTTHVCGQILDPTGQCPGYEGVPVVFTNDSGGVICETTTNSSGGYCCPIPNSEFPITICAIPNCPWPFQNPGAAGITTADLIRIQTFILSLPDPLNPSGIWPSDFLYWVDVNGDGKVTASDIVVLHQYLLGIIDVPMGNRCRVVPHWALNFEPSNNYYNNCNTVFEPSPFGFALGGNFNLYNIGDVNFSGQPDCNLGDFAGGGTEAFVSPFSSFELTPVKILTIPCNTPQNLYPWLS